MHTGSQAETRRVTEKEAHLFFKKQVAKAPVESLIALRVAIEEGQFDGKRYEACVYGHLARGAGYDFHDMSVHEMCQVLRAFGDDLEIEIKADYQHLDPIEMFCAHAGRRDTNNSNEALALIHLWSTEELERRSNLPSVPIEFTETPDGSEHEVFI